METCENYPDMSGSDDADQVSHTQKNEKNIVLETARHFLPGVEIVVGEDGEIVIG